MSRKDSNSRSCIDSHCNLVPHHTSFENRLFQIILQNVFLIKPLEMKLILTKMTSEMHFQINQCTSVYFAHQSMHTCLLCSVLKCKQNRLKLLQKREIFKNRKLYCLVLYSTQHCAMLNVNVVLSVIRSETFFPSVQFVCSCDIALTHHCGIIYTFIPALSVKEGRQKNTKQ